MPVTDSLTERGVAVIGAGNMGAGIAQRIAQEGITVFLVDREKSLAEAGKEKIAVLLEQAIERRIFRPDHVSRILDNVIPTTDMGAIRDTGLVIEAVFEDEEVKRNLFEELNSICAKSTIFATNTSSLSVTELAEGSGRPDRFGGLHFFYHPAKNRLLEVICGVATSRETEHFMYRFGSTIGKTCIRVADYPGFAVNRFFVPWLIEAVRMFDEGVASIPTIETAARRAFGIGMGPFELMNVTGVAIAYHAAASLERTLGSFYKPTESLKVHTEMHENWELKGEADPDRFEEVSDRLLGCVYTVSCGLVEEDVATREDTDRGAVVGLRWLHGPFAMMNRAGTPEALACVRRFTTRYPSLEVPSSLKELVSDDKRWPLSFVEQHVEGSIARIVFNRPEALNALNPDIMRELKECFSAVSANSDVETVIFEGVGKAFVAGADIRFFVDALQEGDFDRIYSFTEEGHELLNAIATSKKLTVAYVDGMALGGGAELALACQKIIATGNASFAFPETGIGIYPGLGGTQRLPRKVGKPLARYFVLCGAPLGADDAVSCGFADALLQGQAPLSDTERGEEIADQARQDTEVRKGQANKSLAEAEALFSDANIETLLAGRLPDQIEDIRFAEKTLKFLSRKAPVALRTAANLIEKGSQTSLEEGLQEELQCLESIFSTEDALEGLSSVGKRRPQFTGR